MWTVLVVFELFGCMITCCAKLQCLLREPQCVNLPTAVLSSPYPVVISVRYELNRITNQKQYCRRWEGFQLSFGVWHMMLWFCLSFSCTEPICLFVCLYLSGNRKPILADACWGFKWHTGFWLHTITRVLPVHLIEDGFDSTFFSSGTCSMGLSFINELNYEFVPTCAPGTMLQANVHLQHSVILLKEIIWGNFLFRM